MLVQFVKFVSLQYSQHKYVTLKDILIALRKGGVTGKTYSKIHLFE